MSRGNNREGGITGADSLLRLARKYRYQKRPLLAIGVYKELINNYPNTITARWGLIEILSAFREAKLDSSAAFLGRLKNIHPNGKMKRVAYDLLTGVWLDKGNIAAAISNGEAILTLYPDTESRSWRCTICSTFIGTF